MTSIQEMNVTGFAYGGASFGNLPNGKICFVRGAVPGERIRVEVIKEKSSFAQGRLLEVMLPSPDRIAPECPVAVTPENAGCDCQGCSYQHIPYELELEWKQKQFEGFICRSALASPDQVLPPFPSPSRYHWRNRIKLSCGYSPEGTFIAGYRGEDNKSIIPIKSCPIARKSINERLAKELAEVRDETVETIYLRWTLNDGAVFWTDKISPPDALLTEQLGAFGKFSVPWNSFFQTNNAVAAELVKRVVDAVKKIKPDHVIELYCGVGVFSIAAAEALESLRATGVELNRPAVKAAKKNAAQRGWSKRIHFHAADAVAFLSGIPEKKTEKSLLILDPPRTGLDKKLIGEIFQTSPQNIIYVSCAPDTLARDLSLLCAGKYEILETGLLDMFPASAHFESMTILGLK